MRITARPIVPAALAAASLVLAVACGPVGPEDEGDFAVDESPLTIDTNATYTIVGVQSNKCVEVQNGSTALQAPLDISDCNGSTRQQFKAESMGSGFYRLRNVNSGLCVDVSGAVTTDGGAVIQYTCGSGTNQQWSFTDVSTGIETITARHSGKVLDVTGKSTSNGALLEQWTSNGGTNQQFKVQAIGSSSGTGGTGGTGGSSGTCTPPAASPLVGWAAVSGKGLGATTGGGSATPTTVTSLSALNSAVGGTTAKVVWVQGTISGNVTVGSNKTIIGVCGAQIHGHIEMSGSANVIIRNIKITGYGVGNCALDPKYDSSVGCSSGQDAITVQKNAHHIWFDHCDISDGTDGNLDITNGADFITVSWTKFHYTPRTDNFGNDSTGSAGHRYSSLIGSTDTPSTYDDANSLNVTWHHDWWAENVVERQPRVRFGKNHFFNNVWSASGNNYCIRAGRGAHLLIQNNVFTGVKSPHQFNNSTDQATAFITASSNTYTNTSGTAATGGGGTPFTSPPYSFTVDSNSSVQSAVQSGAGPK